MIDGETAIQYLYTLPSLNAVQPTLLLPNAESFDCCADFKTMVLAYGDGSDTMKNDFTSFLNLCSPTASAAVYKLYKDGVLVGSLTNNTYGKYYSFGFEVIGLQKFIGYRIDWYLVLDLQGEGIYQLKLEVTDAMLGNVTLWSDEYQLCEYRADRAEQTIRIDWWQNGTIGSMANQADTMNYSDLNWHNQIRLGGFFGYPKVSEGTKEFVRYWNGYQEWVKDEFEVTYRLKTKRIPANIQRLIRTDIMMSDRCTITDYNSKNAETYIDFEIRFEPTNEPNWKPLQSKLSDVELVCKQRFENNKKHRR